MGWMALEPRRGWKLTEEIRTAAGLRLYYVGVPAGRSGERPAQRGLRRGAERLRRAGCRRAVAAPDFQGWEALSRAGLRPVDPSPLCQALAAPLAMAWLEQKGVPLDGAVVALSGGRVDRFFFEAALALAPRVRSLAVEARGGGDLLRLLEREWGLPALEGAPRGADLTLRFPGAAPARGPCLDVSGAEPDFGGLSLAGPEGLPEELEPLPLLALLWEEGRLREEEIRIRPGK